MERIIRILYKIPFKEERNFKIINLISKLGKRSWRETANIDVSYGILLYGYYYRL
jgi:hypothetical protein